MSDSRGAWIEVDLDAIASNALLLASRAPRSRVAPVVKANAYGHGALAVARTLALAGFEPLCVATLSEGLELRAAGLRQRIIILYALPPRAARVAFDADLEVTIGSPEGLRELATLPAKERSTAHVQLKVDTGMTRQGLQPVQFRTLAHQLREVAGTVVGIWTHFADGADPYVVGAQIDAFDAALHDLSLFGVEAPRHAASSAAILAGYGVDYEIVRPGLAVYGAVPVEYSIRGAREVPELVPAMTVRARSVRIASVPPGTRIGYGGTFTTSRRSRLATLPVGYADGLSRALGNGRTAALVHGVRAPIVGRVSMDSCVVDVTEIPSVTHDSTFTLLGKDAEGSITLEQLAAAAGTIPQEIAVGFDHRLPVVYRGGGDGSVDRLGHIATTLGVNKPGGTVR